jgi:hypothetical protein
MTSTTIRESWTSILLQSSNLISLIFSLIGLASSFLLLKLHRVQLEASASEAVSDKPNNKHRQVVLKTFDLLFQGDFLEKYFHNTLGLLPLSIIYALPQVSSVWSFVFLSISMLVFTMHLDSITARILVTIFTVFVTGTLWFIAMCLNKKDDGTGSGVTSAVTDSYRRVRKEIPERVGSLIMKSRNRGNLTTDLESGDVNNEGNNAREQLLPNTNSVGLHGSLHSETSSLSSVARDQIVSSTYTYTPGLNSARQTIVNTFTSLADHFRVAIYRQGNLNRYGRIDDGMELRRSRSTLESLFRNPNGAGRES